MIRSIQQVTLTNDHKEGRLALALVLLFLLFIPANSQEVPDKIRGYKVHREKISVNDSAGNTDAAVRIGDPELADVSLAGITFEFPAEVTAAGQSGKVEFVTFHDFRVNGIKVEPEEYTHKFEFRKGKLAALPNPVRVFLPMSGMVKAAWKEMTESDAEWTITGRVFVFGKFRKYGFHHKRVVPIDLNLTVKNPARGK